MRILGAMFMFVVAYDFYKHGFYLFALISAILASYAIYCKIKDK